jgi:3-methylcrotonyl-CoA carboxylase alpha subunit
MEMNTRLQVEHPVTEMITGLDLVEWQLRIAAGEPLDFAQEDVVKRGHSVEARLYAENPGNRFLPSTGVLKRLRLPESVRVDSGVVEGDVVSMHYDPMLAKVISSGRDRAEAVANLDAALAELELAGVEHNVGYLRRVLKHPRFASGDYTTHLADDHHEELLPVRGDSGLICAVLALQHADAGGDPWQRADGFRLNLAGGYERQFRRDDEDVCVYLSSTGDAATIAGREIKITDASVDGGRVRVIVDNKDVAAQILIDANDVYVLSGGDTERFGLVSVDTADYEDFSETGERLVSPMPGQVVSVMVIEGQDVLEDQVLMVIEAMKMEHAIKAPHAGRVELLHFAVGDKVDEGVELVTLADVAADTDEQTE